MAQAGTLSIEKLGKRYPVKGQALQILDNVSFTVAPGEFVSIVGSSGCGKSTLLRLIVGLENEYEGDIRLDGKPVVGTSLDRGIVFQEHRLFPWLTVEQNIGLALENSQLSSKGKKQTIQKHIELVGLVGFEKAYPYQLSGGMSQRVAIARGLVNRPEVLLLDEPFGALDAMTKYKMQNELQNIWQREGITMILVTHDVEEAVYLGDRVVVMEPRPGRIRRIVPVPMERPRQRSAAGFVAIKEDILSEFGIVAEEAPALID
jgi:sulfonate transport system ATP-binding protein